MKTLNTYMDNAWNDLAEDEGWWKSVLALGLMNCVPIIGQIMMFGYLFDWAKEAAWGMQTPLSRKLGDLGRCVKYGFLALWVMIIWIVPVMVAGFLLGLVPEAGAIIRFFVELFAIIVVGAISAVAAFRSIIYERVVPGLQVRRVLRMVRRDPGGLAQTFSVILLVVPLFVAALFLVLLPAIPFINTIMSMTVGSVLGAEVVPLVLLGMLTLVVALVIWVAGAIVSAFISALYIRSLGYWMSQFDPASWKTPATPMSFEIEMAAEKAAKREAKAAAKPKRPKGEPGEEGSASEGGSSEDGPSEERETV